jgi:murein DD-endopeptidase MepM/ murein hydrolase activator NlpD
MRAIPHRTLSSRARSSIVGALVATLLLALLGTGAAQAADPRVEEAAERTAEVQARLDTLLQELAVLEAEASDKESELAALRTREQAEAQQAQEANGALAVRVREAYIKGSGDPTLQILASGSAAEAVQQARLLSVLADRSRADLETASAARTRTRAAAGEVEFVAEELRGKQAEIDEVRAEVAALLGEAQADEAEIREVVAAEQRERERKEREERERRERAAAEARERELAAQAAKDREAQNRASRNQPAAAAPSAGNAAPAPAQAAPAAAPAPVSGGVACPLGQPRSYSDTWGAARSGGRSHKGTDILAPRGTPIYAYENGSITRMSSNSLGGISLYMRGDSGTVYYYTHLQGYVGGLSAGQRVGVGQQIAFNGDSGNARGIPHLHFEVMPGGGGNVNPYPYVLRACG